MIANYQAVRMKLGEKVHELDMLKDKYNFVEKPFDQINLKYNSTIQIEKNLENESKQIDELIEEEYKKPREHDDIKYELDLSEGSELPEGDEELDDKLDEVVVGLVGVNGEIKKNYVDKATQYDKEAYMYWHDDQGTQTNISLAHSKYDKLFTSNMVIDRVFNQSHFGSVQKIQDISNSNSQNNKMFSVLNTSEFGVKTIG
jgi:hypothetical protein